VALPLNGLSSRLAVSRPLLVETSDRTAEDVDGLLQKRRSLNGLVDRRRPASMSGAWKRASRPTSIFLVNPSIIFYFPDRASWLALALNALFWRVSGTIAGTVQPCVCCPRITNIDKARYGV
jgi:hypothetical protein